jgi:hypothetical protein
MVDITTASVNPARPYGRGRLRHRREGELELEALIFASKKPPLHLQTTTQVTGESKAAQRLLEAVEAGPAEEAERP